ncbi:MAG: hypothetical protein GX811_00390 [Lentisphaerae bacterium]|nr:hypothetical protein [Lentisphaerota bacterium]
MKHLLVAFISSLWFVGCTHPSLTSNSSVQAVHKYDGMTSRQLIATLGKPYYEDSFPLSSALDEMRTPIQKYFNESGSSMHTVTIKEIWWKEDDYYLTAWLSLKGNDWIVLESLRWHKDVQF